MPKPWSEHIKSSKEVADALNWLRWRTKGAGLIFVAIGVNSVSASIDPELEPEDAVNVLSLEVDTIAALIRALPNHTPKTHGSMQRPPR